MKPRVSFITLGVDNLDRALAFYREGLGLPSPGIVGTEYALGAVAFFELQPGLKLALWPRKSLAADSKVALQPPSATEFALAHNVASADEVNALLRRAEQAGATITKPPGPTFYGGHAGYFQDLDGHLWEVAFNPAFVLPD